MSYEQLAPAVIVGLEQLGWQFSETGALKFAPNTETVIAHGGDATWIADLAAVAAAPGNNAGMIGMPAAGFAGQVSDSPRQKA